MLKSIDSLLSDPNFIGGGGIQGGLMRNERQNLMDEFDRYKTAWLNRLDEYIADAWGKERS